MESGSSFARVLLSQRGRVNSSPHIKPDVTPLKSKPTPPAVNTPISPESSTPESPTPQSPAPSPTAKNVEGISYYEQLKTLQKPKRSLPKSSNSPSEPKKIAEVANGNGKQGKHSIRRKILKWYS
jgi:hypothetical protein